MTYFAPLKNPSSFRKLAAAMWVPPNDPHIFGAVDVDASPVLALIERYNYKYNCKLTVTHVVTRALALALARHPELNAKIGWSRIWVRPTIDIFCQVASDNGRDLSGYKIRQVDTLSLGDIADTLSRAAVDIRQDRDPAFKRSRGLMKASPLWFIRLVLKLMSFAVNRLNLDLPNLGMPRDPFGSAMVTSVGMFGIDFGFAPFTPIARCPMIITITRIKERPWVVGERVVPKPVLRICGTFDHRVIDGFQGGVMSTEMESLLSNPSQLLTPKEMEELG
jgi:pyruvate/2-oxoglutarate dehydrogenase complex dihydrolipoamide acyltransferase (E2) component